MIDLEAMEKRARWIRENLESPTATQTADDVDVLIAEVRRLRGLNTRGNIFGDEWSVYDLGGPEEER